MTRHMLISFLAFISVISLAQDLQQNPDIECYLSSQEKVFVDLDRKLLVAGDYLHYKAYLVNAFSPEKADYSKILYYEIIDANFRVMHAWRSNVKNGISIGETLLPDTIPAGIYQLRAFTNWMRNTNHMRFFSTTLIINDIAGEQESVLNYCLTSVQKRIDTIMNDQEDNFIIKLTHEENRFSLMLNSRLSIPDKKCYLNISSRGRSILQEEIHFKENKCFMFIPENKILPGVLLVEIKDDNQVTLARQFTFNPLSGYKINLDNIQDNYQKNNKIAIGLSIPDLEKSQKMRLSISVVEKSPFDSIISPSSISTYFLLNSEFGRSASQHIIAPNDLKSIDHMAIKDYEWSAERIERIHFSYPKETKGYIFSGTISNTQDFRNLAHHILFVANADSIARFKYASPSDEGNFYFLLDSTYDNELLIVQDFKSGIDEIKWLTDNRWEHSKVKTAILQYGLNEKQKQYLDYLHKISLMKRIYNKSYLTPSPSHKKYGCHNFFVPTYTVRPSEYEELPDFEEIASNLLPSIRFHLKKEEYSLSVFIKDHEKIFNDGVGLFLNGIPFSNLHYIASLSSLDITKIDVTNKQIMHGDLTYNGIVSIYTNKQKIQPSSIINSFFYFDNKANPSIIPKEEMHALPGSTPIDDCLFWEPNIEISGGEKITLEWNTLNLESDYWIVINGISDSGISVNKIVDFKVR